jgi:hypothetical protein
MEQVQATLEKNCRCIHTLQKELQVPPNPGVRFYRNFRE